MIPESREFIMSEKMVRATDLDSPDRCGHNIPGDGQCMMMSVEGGTRCKVHGGGSQLRAIKKEQLRAYDRNRWASEIHNNANDPKVKSMTEELGISRMVLNRFLNRCEDSHDLLMMSGPIDNMLKTINLIQKTSHQIDKDMNTMLGPEQLAEFGEQLFNILMDEIEDANTLNRIALKLGGLMRNLQTPNES